MTDRNDHSPDHPNYNPRTDPDAGPPSPGYIWHETFGRWGSPSAPERFGGDMGFVKVQPPRPRPGD